MSVIVKIDGTEYCMGTRIPIAEIREVIKNPTLDTDGQPDIFGEVKEIIEKYGVVVSDEFIKELVSEATKVDAMGVASQLTRQGRLRGDRSAA